MILSGFMLVPAVFAALGFGVCVVALVRGRRAGTPVHLRALSGGLLAALGSFAMFWLLIAPPGAQCAFDALGTALDGAVRSEVGPSCQSAADTRVWIALAVGLVTVTILVFSIRSLWAASRRSGAIVSGGEPLVRAE